MNHLELSILSFQMNNNFMSKLLYNVVYMFLLRGTISIYSQKYFKTKLNFKKNVKSNNLMPKQTFNLYEQAYT